MTRRRPVRWGWLAAAAAVAIAASLLAGTWQGGCAASAAVEGCSSGPVPGVPGTVVMIGLAAGFVVVALVRALRKPTG